MEEIRVRARTRGYEAIEYVNTTRQYPFELRYWTGKGWRTWTRALRFEDLGWSRLYAGSPRRERVEVTA